MPLEESVRRALLEAADHEGVPAAAARRLELLASALADAELEATSGSDLDRRIELVMDGFDFHDRAG